SGSVWSAESLLARAASKGQTIQWRGSRRPWRMLPLQRRHWTCRSRRWRCSGQLAGSLGEALLDGAECESPAFLVLTSEVVVGNAGVPQGHSCLVALRLEGQRDHGFEPARGFRDPRVRDAARTVESDEAAVVRPFPPFMRDGVVKKTVDLRVEDHALAP